MRSRGIGLAAEQETQVTLYKSAVEPPNSALVLVVDLAVVGRAFLHTRSTKERRAWCAVSLWPRSQDYFLTSVAVVRQ